ncbi:hypothetical protein HARCEL1_09860 [Halococcoides cellulosivorans]|uniref:Uncharacterized protein n=1 Tax=Halococcoides cellulosivorans TaxID=1679096 RepID=A0A2R4X2H7_9EURY|nr:hypothetical protein HARCEL1_09860 [Halococcoides cellulosivorans]
MRPATRVRSSSNSRGSLSATFCVWQGGLFGPPDLRPGPPGETDPSRRRPSRLYAHRRDRRRRVPGAYPRRLDRRGPRRTRRRRGRGRPGGDRRRRRDPRRDPGGRDRADSTGDRRGRARL